MPVTLSVVRPKRLYQQIAEQIYELIRAGRYGPGQRLPPEMELAKLFNVSRPSIREAMIVLETAGVIEVYSGSGSYVSERPMGSVVFPWLTPEDPGPGPLEQFRARVLLECELASEAARHATDAEIAELEGIVDRIEAAVRRAPQVTPDHFLFHERLADLSRNSVLAKFLRDLIALNREPMWTTVRQRVDTSENLQKGVAARRRIIAALRRRDAAGAKRAMREHLERIGRMVFGDEAVGPATADVHPSSNAENPAAASNTS